MALFNLGKKKEEKKAPTCCCGSKEQQVEETGCCTDTSKESTCCCGKHTDGICCIKILGAGCKSCHQQFENAKEAVRNLGLSVEVEYITDMENIMDYGVMSMPAIVINEKVVSAGKVLKTEDVEKLLKK